MSFNGGAIAVAGDASLGAPGKPLNFNGGMLRYEAAFVLDASRPINIAAGGAGIDTNGFDVAMNNLISGATLAKYVRHDGVWAPSSTLFITARASCE